MIKTTIGKLSTAQKEEVRSILKIRLASEYVSDLSIFIPILVMIPAAFLSLFAFFSLEDAFDQKVYWTAASFPEYALLYTAFFAASILTFMSFANYLLTLGRHGYLVSSFGLLKIIAGRIIIFPFNTIEKMFTSQVKISHYYDSVSGEISVRDTGGTIKVTQRSKKFDLMISIKGQSKFEVISFSSEKKALAFMEKVNEISALHKEEQTIRTRSWMSPPARWLILSGAALALSLCLTFMWFFQWQNSRLNAIIMDDLFDGKEKIEANLTNSAEKLALYFRQVKNGQYIEMARAY